MESTLDIQIDDGPGRSGPIFAERRQAFSGTRGRCSHVTHDFAALAFYVGGRTF